VFILRISQYLLAVLFVLTGSLHFVLPESFSSIVPSYLPAPTLLVYLTGILLIIFGFMLFFRRLNTISRWGLILILIAVFPANIEMAIHPELYSFVSPFLLWFRLLLQGAFIYWVYSVTLKSQLPLR